MSIAPKYYIVCKHCGRDFDHMLETLPDHCECCNVKFDTFLKCANKHLTETKHIVDIYHMSNSVLNSYNEKKNISTLELKRWFNIEITKKYDENSVVDLKKRIDILEQAMFLALYQLDTQCHHI